MSEAVVPPRALWVPFPLGRPLGAVNDPDFQKNVLRRALGLLDTAVEPTIEDYVIETPDDGVSENWVCPVNLSSATSDSLGERLLAEVAMLRPWAIETRHQRGRTLFGVTGAGEDQVDDVARALATIAESGDVISEPLVDGISWTFEMPLLLRHMADDLRTFYHEAVAAQPGESAPNHDALNQWIFSETVLGETLLLVADGLTRASNVPMAQLVRGLLIPEGYYKGGSAFPEEVNLAIDP
ncbi:MAG: hypothetical protein CL458_08650 [Acidimicrobiaceae bacterium]|nr:hypothetical protein [Acidimicrobiaceae bacterium]|tara:strand:- start:2475 stop:3194 length:720 start_codon:yes stop_codon:yes gene_type:complete